MCKICSKCGKVKEFVDFSTDKRATDGRKSECKQCHNLYNRTKRNYNWISCLSDEYIKSKLTRTGFTTKQINDNPELIELRRNLIILRRTIWQTLKM